MTSQAAITATTHINFRGKAREALGFYQAVFGGQTTLVTNQEGGIPVPPEEAQHIIWGQVSDGKGFRVMGYDVPSNMPWQQGQNAYFVAVEGDTPERVTEHWNRLVEGATVLVPLAPAQWSALYGMLKDRYGVDWALSVAMPCDGAKPE